MEEISSDQGDQGHNAEMKISLQSAPTHLSSAQVLVAGSPRPTNQKKLHILSFVMQHCKAINASQE